MNIDIGALYYGLKVCVPTKFPCWNFNHRGVKLRNRGLPWWLGHENGASKSGTDPHKRNLDKPFPSSSVREHRGKVPSATRKWVFTKHWIWKSLYPGLPRLWTIWTKIPILAQYPAFRHLGGGERIKGTGARRRNDKKPMLLKVDPSAATAPRINGSLRTHAETHVG